MNLINKKGAIFTIKQIYSVNSISIPFSAQQIWEALIDIASYPLWWPSSVKIKLLNSTQHLIGSKVEVRPYGGMPFFCEFLECTDNVKLIMKYSGVYSSLGAWTLTEEDGQTKVSYEINLEINSLFIRLLSYVIPVGKIHSRLMNEVLVGLENRLKSISTSKGTPRLSLT